MRRKFLRFWDRTIRPLRTWIRRRREAREEAQRQLRLLQEQTAHHYEPGLVLDAEARQQARSLSDEVELFEARAIVRASRPRARGWLDKTEI